VGVAGFILGFGLVSLGGAVLLAWRQRTARPA
jgi:hypothetical protein